VITIKEHLERKSSGSGLENREYRRGSAVLTMRHPSIRKKVADKRRSLGRYNSLADSGHGICFFFIFFIKVSKNENNNRLMKLRYYSNLPWNLTLLFPIPKLLSNILLPLHISPLSIHQLQSSVVRIGCVIPSEFPLIHCCLLFLFRLSYFVISEFSWFYFYYTSLNGYGEIDN
jgi:hypothetical protein